jgi:hypothetical protein
MWEAYVRTNRRSEWRLVGVFRSAQSAFAAYKRHRCKLAEQRESRAHVERLLSLSAACPVQIEAFSLHGSTIDFSRWESNRGG